MFDILCSGWGRDDFLMKEGGAASAGLACGNRQDVGQIFMITDHWARWATNEGNKNTAGTNLLKHLDCCISYYLLYRPTAVRSGGWGGGQYM